MKLNHITKVLVKASGKKKFSLDVSVPQDEAELTKLFNGKVGSAMYYLRVAQDVTESASSFLNRVDEDLSDSKRLNDLGGAKAFASQASKLQKGLDKISAEMETLARAIDKKVNLGK